MGQTFSKDGLSKVSIWLFSSLLRRRLQLVPRVFLREFLRNWEVEDWWAEASDPNLALSEVLEDPKYGLALSGPLSLNLRDN